MADASRDGLACRYCHRAFPSAADADRHLAELRALGLFEDHVAIHELDAWRPKPLTAAETADWLTFVYRRAPSERRAPEEGARTPPWRR